jgi:hypothetical protein
VLSAEWSRCGQPSCAFAFTFTFTFNRGFSLLNVRNFQKQTQRPAHNQTPGLVGVPCGPAFAEPEVLAHIDSTRPRRWFPGVMKFFRGFPWALDERKHPENHTKNRH